MDACGISLFHAEVLPRVIWIRRSWTGVISHGMLSNMLLAKVMPGGPLKRQQMTHLKIYAGASHPHDAQNPKPLDIKAMNPKNAVRG